jgi:hypothetical protein
MKVTMYSSFATAGLARKALLALKEQGARLDEVSAFFPSESHQQFSPSPVVGTVVGNGTLAQAWKQYVECETELGVGGFLRGQGIDHRFARDAEQAIGHSNAILLVDCRASELACQQVSPQVSKAKTFGMLKDEVSVLLRGLQAGLVVELQNEQGGS